MSTLRVTFLGTGTSQGVPIIGCPCAVCQSNDERDKRLRTSILVESETTHVVIDSGPDFRQQMLRAGVKKLDGLVFTHSHKDHVAGMDDIRAFNYLHQKPIDVYANAATQKTLEREFEYVFNGDKYPGIPEVNMHRIEAGQTFSIGDITFEAIEVMHYKMPVLGFRIGRFTYITDANFISESSMQQLKGTEVLVLNALRREKHVSHFSLSEAIQKAGEIGARQTYFTHASHQLGKHHEVSIELPEGIVLAYDGLVLDM
ncbi:MAG: MBL fold metallo-hydrolase [Chitinophagaceae bacterium]|nr:MBL fold metallo-hydrolase [Chitinophagaceae bacterium]